MSTSSVEVPVPVPPPHLPHPRAIRASPASNPPPTTTNPQLAAQLAALSNPGVLLAMLTNLHAVWKSSGCAPDAESLAQLEACINQLGGALTKMTLDRDRLLKDMATDKSAILVLRNVNVELAMQMAGKTLDLQKMTEELRVVRAESSAKDASIAAAYDVVTDAVNSTSAATVSELKQCNARLLEENQQLRKRLEAMADAEALQQRIGSSTQLFRNAALLVHQGMAALAGNVPTLSQRVQDALALQQQQQRRRSDASWRLEPTFKVPSTDDAPVTEKEMMDSINGITPRPQESTDHPMDAAQILTSLASSAREPTEENGDDGSAMIPIAPAKTRVTTTTTTTTDKTPSKTKTTRRPRKPRAKSSVPRDLLCLIDRLPDGPQGLYGIGARKSVKASPSSSSHKAEDAKTQSRILQAMEQTAMGRTQKIEDKRQMVTTTTTTATTSTVTTTTSASAMDEDPHVIIVEDD